MSKKLKITISGTTGSGKTTIAAAITAMLAEAGFRIDIDDVDITNKSLYDILPALMARRDALVKDGLEIDVVTEQLANESVDDETPRMH